MDSFMPLILLSLCACARSEPLPQAVQRRSDRGVYASDFARGYKPYTYAAIPLHSPIPVVHILSPVPPAAPPLRHEPIRPAAAPSAQRPIYALPPQQFDAYRYAQAQPYKYAQPYVQPYAQPYAASVNYVMYANEEADENAPTILYARPNPDGGYTYRRKPARKRNAPKPKRPSDGHGRRRVNVSTGYRSHAKFGR